MTNGLTYVKSDKGKAEVAAKPGKLPTGLKTLLGLINNSTIAQLQVKVPQVPPDKLQAALKKALSVESVREKYRSMGVEIMDFSQAGFAAYVKTDYEKWRLVAREANIVVE